MYPEKKLIQGAVIDRKLGMGCGNIAREAAMSVETCERALQTGEELVAGLREMGYTLVATGEMGIGNTTPTSALAAVLLQLSPEEATGRGAGLDDAGLERKRQVVEAVCRRVEEKQIAVGGGVLQPVELLAEAGGFEIAMMAGVFLGGVKHHVPIVIDGAISAVAALVADCMDNPGTGICAGIPCFPGSSCRAGAESNGSRGDFARKDAPWGRNRSGSSFPASGHGGRGVRTNGKLCRFGNCGIRAAVKQAGMRQKWKKD